MNSSPVAEARTKGNLLLSWQPQKLHKTLLPVLELEEERAVAIGRLEVDLHPRVVLVGTFLRGSHRIFVQMPIRNYVPKSSRACRRREQPESHEPSLICPLHRSQMAQEWTGIQRTYLDCNQML
jgi:hypothetical protein